MITDKAFIYSKYLYFTGVKMNYFIYFTTFIFAKGKIDVPDV